MKHFVLLAFMLALFLPTFAHAEGDALAAGNKLYAEKSYQLAEAEFAKSLTDKLDTPEARETAFKWADSVIQGKDDAQQQEAEKKLEALKTSSDHDRWWAEAGVTLAGIYTVRDPWNKNADIKKYLDDARDYWAGSDDIDTARTKFIAISFQLSDFVTEHNGWYNVDIRPIRLGGGRIIPPVPVQPQGNETLQILFEEILKVATDANDKARAHYGLGMASMQDYSGDATTQEKSKDKAAAEFKTVLDDFADSDWADDAGYQLGILYENRSDFVKAAEAYKNLAARYKKGESKWLDEAQRRLESIMNPQLGLSVGNNFIPGSEIQFSLSWRNVKSTHVTFYNLDLASQLVQKPDQSGYNSYQDILQALAKQNRFESLPKALESDITLTEEGKHIYHSEYKGLADWRKAVDVDAADPKAGQLPAGAYMVVATAPGVAPAYDLVLVTDLAVVSKVAKDTAVFFVMGGKDGHPRANASVRFAYSYADDNGNTHWETGQGKTGDDGLLKSPLQFSAKQSYSQQHSMFAVASVDDKQAFVQNNYYSYYSGAEKGAWWLYAFSDRPAYRPGEKISFKGILRQPKDGLFATPAGMKVKAQIFNPQGAQVKEATYTLNDYGAFDDTLTLDDKAILGEYRMELYAADNSAHLSSSQLFRLEEYKLPEYTVSVAPQKNIGKDGIDAYRLGDTVNVDVTSKYYFGGPVANADVEYMVYEQPLYHLYRPWRKYAWYYDDMFPMTFSGLKGQLMKTAKIKTDDKGVAHFSFDTPKDSANDLQYHIEARVVDKSRREIIGSSDIKVTKTAYFATLDARQSLYRPGDKVEVDLKTLTANDVPVSVEGKVRVLRNWWRDAVVQDGKLVTEGHYDGTEILSKFVKTNEKGEAVVDFSPTEDGYYSLEFTGYDNGNPVPGIAYVYVCKESSVNIGYQYNGLQIITEKDTYKAGDTLRAMIVSDKPDSYVLLTAENDNLYSTEVLHMDGSVKLLEMKVAGNETPNFFLNAVSGDHYQLKSAGLQIIVPPEEKFLNVNIASDKAEYQPREDGTFDVTVTDNNGKPVSADIALGLTDAAVYYIQDEYAPDIRKFFYGDKKQLSIQTQASFYQRPYVTLLRDDKGNLVTDEEKENQARRDRGELDENAPGQPMDRLRQTGSIGGAMFAGRAAEGAAVPAAAPVMAMKSLAKNEMMDAAIADKKDMPKGAAINGAPAGDEAAPVRNDFRSTVIWLPSVKTDANGKATVKATFPDSLTTWRLTARADTADTAVGTVTHEVISSKPLMVRLQAPRFFTERDVVDVSAVIDNMTDNAITVTPKLTVEGLVVTGLFRNGAPVKGEQGPLEVPAHGQARADWAVAAQKAGLAKINVQAGTGKLSDAMEKTYPVIPHGIEKFVAQSLALKDGGEKTLSISIPKERIKESSSLRLSLSPSLAGNLMDALPYLADYPYGCVEQTMSRFLPAVIVGKTMRDLGISKNDVDAYISDVLTPRNDPKGHPQRREDATYNRLNDMTADGLKRLYDFQHNDGGWGWWKDGDSDRFMSAYVVWGLALAKSAGVEVREETLSKAVNFLQEQLVQEEDQPDMLAWMLHALSYTGSRSDFEDKQRNRLWEMRDKLNPYTRALFALSEQQRGDVARAQTLARNLANGVIEDKDNGTAHWGEAGVNYRWSDGGVEATAFSIAALSQIDPGSAYLAPAVKWMALNRRGASWKNTRDTAIAILGLSSYLKATQELSPDYSYDISVNGKPVRSGKVDGANIFSFSRIIDLPADALKDGDNTVTVSMKGRGALYVAAYAKYFTLEEPITKAGNEVFVTRKYYRQSVKETLMKGYTDNWSPLKDGDTVNSGDRIRVELNVEAKNNYEYLLAEDYKPAGFEAVTLTSGSGSALEIGRDGKETGNSQYLYQEFRDQKAAFFIDHLKQGKYAIRYELRAETPGRFHAMPDQLEAMYVPEIRANSDETRLNVTEDAKN